MCRTDVLHMYLLHVCYTCISTHVYNTCNRPQTPHVWYICNLSITHVIHMWHISQCIWHWSCCCCEEIVKTCCCEKKYKKV